MSICSVCGRKVKNINCNIIRGKGGQWICKECLKKAGIGVMKFSSQSITAAEISAMIDGTMSREDLKHKTHTPVNDTLKKQRDFKKTIACRTCGAKISPRAKRCPHCGEMTPGEMINQTVIGLILAPFIVILILISCCFYFGLFSCFLK